MAQSRPPARRPNPGGPSAPPAARPAGRRSRSPRFTAGLVGLSSAAIVSVYAVGYANTRNANNGLLDVAQAVGPDAAPTSAPQARQQVPVDPAPRTGSNGSQQPSPTPTRTASNGSQQSAANPTRTPAGQAQTQPQSASGYRDGTYVGVGNSRHGSIQATVVVNGGKITSAAVTGCGTRYPCSKVTPLVNQVLTIQAAPVNYVSGATDSSQAYYQAVASALTKARAQAS